MTNVLAGVGITLFITALFVPYIAGAVIARRAWRRNGWPEARLAFRAFVAGPVIYIVAAVTFPLAGWLMSNSSVIDMMQALALIAAAANGTVTIVIAVALYRLARRSARPSAPANSLNASTIGHSLT